MFLKALVFWRSFCWAYRTYCVEALLVSVGCDFWEVVPLTAFLSWTWRSNKITNDLDLVDTGGAVSDWLSGLCVTL